MSIERKLRMAYRIQIICLVATAGLVTALVLAQPGTEISAILLLVAVILATAGYAAPFGVRCPKCQKPVFFYKEIYFMGMPTRHFLLNLEEPERVCSRCGKILIHDR